MPLPSLALGLICSLLIGALFHLWRDGGPGKLLLYFALSIAGFAVGQWVGNEIGLSLFLTGPLNLGMAALGSIVFLLLGNWLSHVELRQSTHDDSV
jgi:hypothetical protein